MALKVNMSLAFAVLLLVGISSMEVMSRSLHVASMVEKHEQWMVVHGRVYKDAAEKEMCFKIFKANVQHIDAFNSEKGKSYKLGVNAFTDLTNEEFRVSRNGFKVSSHPRTTSFRYENLTAVPSSMDWRQKGAVTPVKDQG
ncbi:putative fruit bromelain [Helianthus anomalus]